MSGKSSLSEHFSDKLNRTVAFLSFKSDLKRKIILFFVKYNFDVSLQVLKKYII